MIFSQKLLKRLLCIVCFFVIALILASSATASENVSTQGDKASSITSVDSSSNAEDRGEIVKLREPTFLPQFGDIHVRSAIETEPLQEPVLQQSDPSPDIALPLVFNDDVERYIRYFSTTKKDLFRRWLKRKRLYEPFVTRVLKEYGLPEDLIYLAMIESGFNLQAHSPMNADGPWQFIPETGKKYGLTVNHWIDERRDIQKSTVAAARYLQQLFDQFDCWYLAAAAYNAGENRIDRLIKRHDTRDFWQLSTYNTLPSETREYVPRLIAAAILSKNPEKYGFDDIDPITPFQFSAHRVPGGVPLSVVAKAASTDLDALKALNPELLTDITPPGDECLIKLPVKTNSKKFRIALASMLKKERRVIGAIDHMIKGQEDVLKITKTYGVSRNELIMVNDSRLDLKQGSLVYIPQFSRSKKEENLNPIKTADLRRQPHPQNSNSVQTADAQKGKRVVGNAKKTSHKTNKKYGMLRRKAAHSGS